MKIFPLIVTGTQRSGLSLTTSFLQSVGVKIDQEIHSKTGFLNSIDEENLDFSSFHIEVLRSQGLNPDGWILPDQINVNQTFLEKADQLIAANSQSSVWGWQEPRTTLLLNFWAEQIPEAKFLLIYRAPWQVVDSLYRHQNFSFQHQPELAFQYWLHYNQRILQFYNQYQSRSILANIETIVQYPKAYIATLNEKFNLNLSEPNPTVYDSVLLNNKTSSESHRISLIDYYFSEVTQLYQELDSRSWHPEQKPDFSWQQLIESSPYQVEALKDWARLRQLEVENESLHTQLKSTLSESQKSNFALNNNQDELEKITTKLTTKEQLLQQSKTQLRETEVVLEKSQEQLKKTESLLQESQNQLQKTRRELDQTKIQLHQTQYDVMRYQSQLHQTQEELEYYELHRQDWENAESKLYEAEALLSQLMMQLQQTQKQEERFQIQLHQTLEELEQKNTQLQQDREALQQATHQVKQLKRDLKRSNSQLYQVQGELDLYHSQLQKSALELKQKQAELTQTQSQDQQTKQELKQKQAKIHQLQTELKRSQAQLYELQVELAQSQVQFKQMQERQRLEQAMAEDPKQQSQIDYNLSVWDAWNAYRNGKLPLMKQHLQQALKVSKTSPSEMILTWLETFSNLSLAQGFELDSHSLTNSEEWQQLMRQIMVKKPMPLPLMKRYPSMPEDHESEPIALSRDVNPNLN